MQVNKLKKQDKKCKGEKMQNFFREIKKQLILESRKRINFPAHIHDDIELVFVKKGGGTAYCDGKKYILSENSFFLVFPNQVHHYIECSEGEYLVLIIKPFVIHGYNNVFGEGTPSCALWHFEENGDDNAVHLMETAIKEFERDGYSLIIEAYLTAFFGKLLKFYEIKKSSVNHDTVSQILQYCTAHYKENITVEQIAEKLHLSKSTISHIFSSRVSMNFCDYINSLRLTDAQEMLKNKNYSITEISYLCGFSTIRTFNRAFFKRHGVSPSAFRKS